MANTNLRDGTGPYKNKGLDAIVWSATGRHRSKTLHTIHMCFRHVLGSIYLTLKSVIKKKEFCGFIVIMATCIVKCITEMH